MPVTRSLRLLLIAFIGMLPLAARADDAVRPAFPPLPPDQLQAIAKNPQAWRAFVAKYTAPAPASPEEPAPPATGPWFPLENLLPSKQSASNPLLLTDGSVIVHVSCTGTWYKLTPSHAMNGYQNGTWSKIAEMPGGYTPRFFASAVLPDGRVIVEGGEYAGPNCTQIETNEGAIYDPIANTWTSVPPPPGWNNIGDASATVLDDGTFLLSNVFNGKTVVLDPKTLEWTPTGTGKHDSSSEENWTLLPDGDVLTVDAYVQAKSCGRNSEIYNPSSGTWTSAGNTPNLLTGCSGAIPTHEAPTQILIPDGTVLALGATASTSAQNLPVYSALFDTGTNTWSKGPNMPQVNKIFYTAADAPAAVLPDGNVLFAASPSIWMSKGQPSTYPPPAHFFVYDGSTFTQVADMEAASIINAFQMNFLVLPTGHIFAVQTDQPFMAIFASANPANSDYAPVITSLSSHNLGTSGTYSVTGKQFNGLTYGAAFGDDVQASTNYPIVQLTTEATGQVYYARTFDFGVSIKPGAVSTTKFTMPDEMQSGPADLVVIANGIPSKPERVNVNTEFIALSPTPCIEIPMAGGTETFTASIKFEPPHQGAMIGWSVGDARQPGGVTAAGDTKYGNVWIGPAKSATFHAPSGTYGNGIVASLYTFVKGVPQLVFVDKGSEKVSVTSLTQIWVGVENCPTN